MKKTLAILLSILLLMACVPLSAISVSAATSGTTGDCTWTLDGTHLTISGNGKMKNYSYGCGPWGESITSVTIRNGVTTIGNSAFSGCESLTSVTIPNSVTTIGDWAFFYCPLTSVTIPNSVTSIGDNAFRYCTSLTSVTIPNSVTTIGRYAFSGCDSLTSMAIPNSVTTIGNSAFSGCESLTSMIIPNSVTFIGSHACDGCTSLTNIYYGGTQTDKEQMTIDSFNAILHAATWHYNYKLPCNHTYNNACDTTCNKCGIVRQVPGHRYSNACDRNCNVCGATRIALHVYDNACDTTCNECGAVRQVPNHLYDNACDIDCNVCGFVREVGDHVYTDKYDADCDQCGAIREAAILFGDANGDGAVNNKDLGLLQQYLNEWEVTVIAAAIDVDGNGRVNNKDLGLLQRYLNGWDVTLGPDEPGNPGGSDNPDDPPIVPGEPIVVLPEVGYDLDGRGRILVQSISREGNVVTVTLENKSGKWLTEENSYVKYTCTDADGNVLSLDAKYYGTLYFGMLEAKEVDSFTIVLPEGTAKLEFGTCRITYWSQWG